MKIFATLFLAGALLAGCQSAPKTSDAVVAGGLHEIQEFTNQTTAWSCPKCGADFDAPGQCPNDHVDLVENHVSYICPADGEPVEHAGKCPRCNMNARVVRTAVAANVPDPQSSEGTGSESGQ
jgi:predicted RNA-binding Zn-ribbon protein involved in translation (DUF1610 family)